MLDNVHAFLNGDKMSADLTKEVLNAIAHFDVEDGDRDYKVVVEDETFTGDAIYDAIYKRFECVESEGGEGQGDSGSLVFRDLETDQHFRFDFEYQSYHGFYYEYGTWSKVTPRQVTVTQYVRQK